MFASCSRYIQNNPLQKDTETITFQYEANILLVLHSIASSIIIKLDLCDIAFLCQASPPKALIVQY